MTFPTTLRLAALILLLTLLTPSMSMAGSAPVTSSRFYQVHYLGHGMLQVLAKQACGGHFTGWCSLSTASEGFLEFTGTEEQQNTLAEQLEKRDVPPPTQVFLVHLLRAKTGQETLPQLPPNATRALTDLMQLLPYRGFELLDSGLLRTSKLNGASEALGALLSAAP